MTENPKFDFLFEFEKDCVRFGTDKKVADPEEINEELAVAVERLFEATIFYNLTQQEVFVIFGIFYADLRDKKPRKICEIPFYISFEKGLWNKIGYEQLDNIQLYSAPEVRENLLELIKKILDKNQKLCSKELKDKFKKERTRKKKIPGPKKAKTQIGSPGLGKGPGQRRKMKW